MNRFETDIKELQDAWKRSPYPTVKITSYFQVYAELFSHLRGTDCVFVETGVLDGGSLFMWRAWLGPKARIIGIDLNPEALKWKEHGFEIFIGDQGDPEFWKSTLKTIGHFDALLDDGGHQSFQQIVTLTECLRAAQKPCVIAIEDTATSFFKDFASHGRNTFLNYAKDSSDLLIGKLKLIYGDRFSGSLNERMLKLFESVQSVKFFTGIVAYQVVPGQPTAELVRNLPPNSASDFRYEGKNSAIVDWPFLLQKQRGVVKGGLTPGVRLRRGAKKWVPTFIKRAVKRAISS